MPLLFVDADAAFLAAPPHRFAGALGSHSESAALFGQVLQHVSQSPLHRRAQQLVAAAFAALCSHAPYGLLELILELLERDSGGDDVYVVWARLMTQIAPMRHSVVCVVVASARHREACSLC